MNVMVIKKNYEKLVTTSLLLMRDEKAHMDVIAPFP